MQRKILKKTMMEMTWCEIDEMAKKNAIVLLPIGVIEEHSRHLPLATDIYLAIAQAEDLADEMEKCGCPCIIAPPFYWGMISVVTKHFPGSFVSKEETVVAVLKDILESLENAGFKKVISVNAHGDPAHRIAIVRAFREFNKEHELKARWLTFEDDMKYEGFNGTEEYVLPVPPYPFEKMIQCTREVKDEFDVHAGAFETAFMRDIFPEMVNMTIAKKLMPTMMNEEGKKKWKSDIVENKDIIPDGHAGDPAFSQYIKTDMKSANIEIAHGIIKFYEEKEA